LDHKQGTIALECITPLLSDLQYKEENCLVVFSGGQDSTTCLFWALHHFNKVQAVFFRYGQRHAIEEDSASYIANHWNIPLHILDLTTFSQIGGNSLTNNSIKISHESNSIPNTFVPGRNLIFLTYAAALAYTMDVRHLVTGVCETDYSGYPDCRQPTMTSLQNTLRLGIEKDFEIHTPLMHLSKAQTILMAQQTGAMDALAYSHTCYEGQYPPCGTCPSCLLRAKGFQEAGLEDPIFTRPMQ
jgi:7-cyano-7-deazaguanine synthase